MARIKLKYVNSFRNRDRKDARVRFYFRRRGHNAIPLPGLPGSEEFMAAYAAALAAEPASDIGASRTLPGTVAALVVAYYRSNEWNNQLAPDTRRSRRRFIEAFRNQNGDKRASQCSAATTSNACSPPSPHPRPKCSAIRAPPTRSASPQPALLK